MELVVAQAGFDGVPRCRVGEQRELDSDEIGLDYLVPCRSRVGNGQLILTSQVPFWPFHFGRVCRFSALSVAQSLACLSDVNLPAPHPLTELRRALEKQDVSLCPALAQQMQPRSRPHPQTHGWDSAPCHIKSISASSSTMACLNSDKSERLGPHLTSYAGAAKFTTSGNVRHPMTMDAESTIVICFLP